MDVDHFSSIVLQKYYGYGNNGCGPERCPDLGSMTMRMTMNDGSQADVVRVSDARRYMRKGECGPDGSEFDDLITRIVRAEACLETAKNALAPEFTVGGTSPTGIGLTLAPGASGTLTFTFPVAVSLRDAIIDGFGESVTGPGGSLPAVITSLLVGADAAQVSNVPVSRFQSTRTTGNRNNFRYGTVSAGVSVQMAITNLDPANPITFTGEITGTRLDRISRSIGCP